jgi:hypothetical protein
MQLVLEKIPYERVEWIPLAHGRRKWTAPNNPYDHHHHQQQQKQQQKQQHAACLTTGPKRDLHLLESSFNLQYILVSLKSSSSCLRLLPRLPPLLSFLYLSINNVLQTAVVFLLQ